MSASQYRSQLERKRDQRADAERRTGDHRSKEANYRARAAHAIEMASRTRIASLSASKIREAGRLERQANDAGKEAARWQKRSAELLKEEAVLQRRLAAEEERERDASQRQYKRERDAAERAAANERVRILARLTATESLVTRHLPKPKPESLRILMLAASSEGDLRVAREQTRIRRAVEAALHRDLVKIESRGSATVDDLYDGLTRVKPHVVHFSGHGAEDTLYFEDDVDPKHHPVGISAEQFARAIGAVDRPPLLVVLNSCDSAGQAERLAESVVPFAIGMSAEIADTDAINYSAWFYSAITNGESILAAHELAKLRLEQAGLAGHELPVLSSAPDADPAAAVLVLPPAA